MSSLILGHAGGLDEMGIIVLPALMGFGTWMLTRRRHTTETKPNYPVAQVSPSPLNSNGTGGVEQPGWKQASDRSTAWTRPGSSSSLR